MRFNLLAHKAILIVLGFALCLNFQVAAKANPGRPTTNYEVISSKSLRADLLKASKLTKLTGVITPPLTKPRTVSNLYSTRCHLMVFDTKFGDCIFGDKKSEKTLFLFGDSHAAQWFPAIEDIANKYGYKLYALTKSACGISTVIPKMARLGGKPYKTCEDAQNYVINKITEVKPDLVILASRLIDEKGPRGKSWFSGMTEQLKKIKTAADGKVIYLGDTPYPGFEVAQCLLNNPNQITKCNSSLKSAKQNNLSGPGAKAAANAGVVYVSLVDWFCSIKNCPATLNNVLLYIDYSHITTEASKMYSPLLYKELAKFL